MTRRDIANRRWLGKSTERTGHDRVELAAKIATYLMNVARRLATGDIGTGRQHRTTDTLAQCAQDRITGHADRHAAVTTREPHRRACLRREDTGRAARTACG